MRAVSSARGGSRTSEIPRASAAVARARFVRLLEEGTRIVASIGAARWIVIAAVPPGSLITWGFYFAYASC